MNFKDKNMCDKVIPDCIVFGCCSTICDDVLNYVHNLIKTKITKDFECPFCNHKRAKYVVFHSVAEIPKPIVFVSQCTKCKTQTRLYIPKKEPTIIGKLIYNFYRTHDTVPDRSIINPTYGTFKQMMNYIK